MIDLAELGRQSILDHLEEELKSLLKGEFSSLSLTFNEGNGPNYQTVEKYVSDDSWGSKVEWVSEEEKRRAIEKNSMWELHWYPLTPIGFHRVAASSLSALLKGVS